jgi:predicted DNA-binding transcriptional regulator YafY
VAVVDIIGGEEGAASDTSARRWLGELEAAFDQVIRLPGRPARWVFRHRSECPPDRWELLALGLARSLLGFLRESTLDESLRSLVADRLAHLPLDDGAPLDLSRMFFVKSRTIAPLGLDPNVVDRVADAILTQHVLMAEYTGFKGQRDYITFEPYSIVFGEHGVYCYGLCTESDNPNSVQRRRLYHLGRFRRLKRLADRFSYPARDEYDPAEVWRYSFGIFAHEDEAPEQVTLSFAANWARYLERHRFHETQEVLDSDRQGRVALRFHLRITPDLVRWIRGFGADVRVVGPKRLAAAVLERDA